jgi:hypothetical protein
MLFVPKKNGKLRIYVDYRKFNDIIIKNRYTLLLIHEHQGTWKLKTDPILLKVPSIERAPRAHPNHICYPKARPNPATLARPQQPKTRIFTVLPTSQSQGYELRPTTIR